MSRITEYPVVNSVSDDDLLIINNAKEGTKVASKATLFKGTASIRELTKAPDDQVTFPFTAQTAFNVGSTSIPKFSKGMHISKSSDAVLIAVDTSNNVYVAFRANGTWNNARKI